MRTDGLLTGAVMLVALLGTSACFTGVESTPRIGLSDVRKQQAATVTDEQKFLDGLVPLPPSAWKPGHRLRVTDDKIGLALTARSAPADNLAGRDLYFEHYEPAVSLTGTDAIEFVFAADSLGSKDRYFYRIAVPVSEIDTLSAMQVPFTIDMELVAKVDSMMRGNTYYVRTPLWYAADAPHESAHGLRHIAVVIDSVVAGDANYPLSVLFSQPGHPQNRAMVYMTVGKSKASTRNFDVLFSFRDPRQVYQAIKDDVWALIIHSRVKEGMTREECRLALGSPTTVQRIPTYGGMREVWQYSDGVFLHFDDGLLSRYRL